MLWNIVQVWWILWNLNLNFESTKPWKYRAVTKAVKSFTLLPNKDLEAHCVEAGVILSRGRQCTCGSLRKKWIELSVTLSMMWRMAFIWVKGDYKSILVNSINSHTFQWWVSGIYSGAMECIVCRLTNMLGALLLCHVEFFLSDVNTSSWKQMKFQQPSDTIPIPTLDVVFVPVVKLVKSIKTCMNGTAAGFS